MSLHCVKKAKSQRHFYKRLEVVVKAVDLCQQVLYSCEVQFVLSTDFYELLAMFIVQNSWVQHAYHGKNDMELTTCCILSHLLHFLSTRVYMLTPKIVSVPWLWYTNCGDDLVKIMAAEMWDSFTSGLQNRNELKRKKEDLWKSGKLCSTREEIERREKEIERRENMYRYVEREGRQETLYNWKAAENSRRRKWSFLPCHRLPDTPSESWSPRTLLRL